LGHARSALEVHETEGLADLLVGLWREAEFPRRAPATHLDVLVLGLAGRHRRVGQVRNLKQDALDPGIDALELVVERLDAVADLAPPRLLGGRILAAALGLADRLRSLVAQGLEILALAHEPAALAVERDQRLDQLGASAVREGALHRLRILADQPDVQHVRSSLSPKQKWPPEGRRMCPGRGAPMTH